MAGVCHFKPCVRYAVSGIPQPHQDHPTLPRCAPSARSSPSVGPAARPNPTTASMLWAAPSAEGGLFLSQNTQSPVAQMKSLLFTTSLSRSFCVPLLAYDKLLTIEKERATKCLSMFLFVSLFQDLFFSMSLSEIDAHVLC